MRSEADFDAGSDRAAPTGFAGLVESNATYDAVVFVMRGSRAASTLFQA
jgi:hypothetical protein